MTKWATIDREKLKQLRNEKSAEFRALVDGDSGQLKSDTWTDALESAALLGCVQALDAVIEATKPRSEE